MKQFTTLLLVAAIITAMLFGCSSNTQPSTTEPTTAPSTTEPTTEPSTTEPTSTEPTTEPSTTEPTSTEPEEIDVFQFEEVETISENIDIYRAEVSARLEKVENGESFFTVEDREILKHWVEDVEKEEIEFNTNSFSTFNRTFVNVSHYFYPVLFREGHSLVLWYTTEHGSILLEKVEGWLNGGNYIGHLHCDSQEEEWISKHNGSVLTWDETAKTEQVKRYYFGEVVETYTVPEGAIYCGFSDWEGYLFRVGTDVYSLDLGTQSVSAKLACIAHDVLYVIDSAYALGSDPWSQPLFQMVDGSIKAYVSWEGDKDAPVDDPSHLVAPWYEGGYQ